MWLGRPETLILKYSLKHLVKPFTVISLSCLLSSCGGDYKDNNTSTDQPTQPNEPLLPDTPVVPIAEPVPAFDSDGVLSANIRWTDYGVPHVTADNLQSMSYGVG